MAMIIVKGGMKANGAMAIRTVGEKSLMMTLMMGSTIQLAMAQMNIGHSIMKEIFQMDGE